ncbi:MAG: N-acetyltransferase [Acidobacteria bacterium]|nr:MAG: N-acetyltransferase [Acidobacteriota bacterium]
MEEVRRLRCDGRDGAPLGGSPAPRRRTKRHGRGHPVLGDEVDGSGGVVGWAAIGPWSPRGAYRRTGETSVYVEPEHRGAGIGKALLADLVERARGLDEIHVLLARISQPNPASVAAHTAAGFRSFGVQRRCGEKLGRILDVELFDLDLDG